MRPFFITASVRLPSGSDILPARSTARGRKRQEPARRSLVTRAAIALIVATLVLLAGIPAAQARTEIQFWHAMDGQLGEAVGELVNQFNRSQVEFEVKAVYKGTYPQVLSAAMAAYRQKNAPHIVQVYEVGTLSMILSDTIVPIYRLMQQQRTGIDWADFIEMITGYYTKNDRLSSMPFNVSTPILYFNKDAFRRAGLGDTPPATWQEVETASRRILASGAATCGFSTTWPSWTMLENTFSWHNQPFATNQNGYAGLDTRLLINGSFGQMHIGALVRWQKENIFSWGGREGQLDPRFINGDCAMFIHSSAAIGAFEDSLKFDWGTGQLPHWGPPYAKGNIILGGATLWVMRGHEPGDDQGVAQFLKFIAEPRQQAWWASTTGYLPITRTALRKLEADSFYEKNPEQWPAMRQLAEAQVTAEGRGIRLGNYVQVRDAIESELEEIFSGRKTVKQGLDAAVLRGNAILREFSVRHGAAPQGEI